MLPLASQNFRIKQPESKKAVRILRKTTQITERFKLGESVSINTHGARGKEKAKAN